LIITGGILIKLPALAGGGGGGGTEEYPYP